MKTWKMTQRQAMVINIIIVVVVVIIIIIVVIMRTFEDETIKGNAYHYHNHYARKYFCKMISITNRVHVRAFTIQSAKLGVVKVIR